MRHFATSRSLCTFVLLGVLLVLSSSSHGDWVRFRGPNGTGISDDAAATPVEWTPETLKWKVALPGPGSSCPIVVGDKVFVTCWSGYGMSRENRDPGDQQNLKRHLVCVNKNNGDIIWKRSVDAVLPEDRYGGMFEEHGYASHTPTSDGEHVYVFFGKTGVLAFDLDGNKVWQKSVGTESGARNWGSSSSPLLFENLVIVPATAESESLVALDKTTGKEIWRAEAAGFNSTWGSPVLSKAGTRTDVVMAIPGELWGINAKTGKLSWYSDAVSASSMCSSAVLSEDGVAYIVETGPGGGGGAAIRVGGEETSKDITDSNTVWTSRQSNRIATPILYEGRLYTIANRTVQCVDAKTGKQIFRSRLQAGSSTGGGASQSDRGGRSRRGGRGGQDYGSPVLADGKIYYTARSGETYVMKPGDKLEQLAVNRVTTDSEDFSATPAVSDGALFIRSSKHLYCVANE